jgi:replication factor C subunit 1
MSEKHSVQTPFNIIPQLIGPYAWSKTNRSTLSDKMELYFQDFSFVPLFIQVRIFTLPFGVTRTHPSLSSRKTTYAMHLLELVLLSTPPTQP